MPAPSARRRPWLAIAAALTLPHTACTFVLWQDNRSHVLTPVDAPPALRAFRDPDVPTGFVVQVSPAAVQALREHAPEVPADLGWLRVRARHRDFGKRLAEVSEADARWPVRLVLFRDAPRDAPFWTLDPPVAVMDPLGFGVDWRRLYDDAACDVTPLAAEPTTLGAPLHAVAVEYATRADDGTPVLWRVALTPVAVVGDCVFVAAGATALVVWVAVLPLAWTIRQIGQAF